MDVSRDIIGIGEELVEDLVNLNSFPSPDPVSLGSQGIYLLAPFLP
jgi:hypothetical protein